MTGRDANQGECAQACRWRYSLQEEARPGEYFPVFEDEYGTYVFNSKDLCLLERLPEICRTGVDSLKIEGRMKSVHYVATVVGVYRQAIDALFAAPREFSVLPRWREELAKISHRPYTEGFAAGRPADGAQVYATSSYRQTHDFVGLVKGYGSGRLVIEQRNNVKQGDILEALTPEGEIFSIELAEMLDADGNAIIAAAHPQQIFNVPFAHALPENSLLRRRIHDG